MQINDNSNLVNIKSPLESTGCSQNRRENQAGLGGSAVPASSPSILHIILTNHNAALLPFVPSRCSRCTWSPSLPLPPALRSHSRSSPECVTRTHLKWKRWTAYFVYFVSAVRKSIPFPAHLSHIPSTPFHHTTPRSGRKIRRHQIGMEPGWLVTVHIHFVTNVYNKFSFLRTSLIRPTE